MKNYSEAELDAMVLDSFGELTYKIRFEITDGFSSPRPLKKYEDFLIKTLGASVYNKIRGLFYSEEYRKGVLADMERAKVVCVTYFSQEYPDKLKNIPAPPKKEKNTPKNKDAVRRLFCCFRLFRAVLPALPASPECG